MTSRTGSEPQLDATQDGDVAARGFQVVGIGASAGGLRALQHFFDAVQPESGMAYVVIMHLDPDRESRIDALLQDRTSMPVVQVTRTVEVEPEHVYLIPPGHELVMRGSTLQLEERTPGRTHLPVDRFFRTLAESWGADAIGVVLSGTGTDGTVGIRAIKERGGITVAQLPEEAESDGMPTSAIATGQVDLVLPSAGIPVELRRVRSMPAPLEPRSEPGDTEAQLARIFTVLRRKTGHDFGQYRRSTVLRRLDRRLRFNDVETLDDYVQVLHADPLEADRLVRDLLISVSSYFRDPEAFDALADSIPELFAGKGPADAVRVWVVGCATGEEAYSIAILLHEHAATLDSPPRIQLFATDIDEKGYAWGREALYSASAVAEIRPDRLRRFFTQESGGYRVGKSLRDDVLFAVHNVLDDPPFSRMDLITCRNLLIYLQPDGQKRVLKTFHYALRSGGLLFLGSTESAGDNGHFVSVSSASRVFRRDDSPHRAPPPTSAADPLPRTESKAVVSQHPASGNFAYGALHLRMLEDYAPASLVVDERSTLVHLSTGAGRYLHLGGGEPSHNLLDLVCGTLRTELRTALYQAFARGLPTVRTLRLEEDGSRTVLLRVEKPIEGESAGRFALVVIADAPVPDGSSRDGTIPEGPDAVPETLAQLGEHLKRTREQAEDARAERDRTVEQLRYANEELMSINEEQKAASEELEVSREEIQSINEELTTINQEHRTTIEELKRTNEDLQNLIEATDIGTIFLDRELRVRRFTPPVERLFNFVATDRGRPIEHITHCLDYPELGADVRGVIASRDRIEREVVSGDGEWYIVRVNPYRSAENEIDGVVLTFFEHTAQKRVDNALREAKDLAERATLVKGSFLSTMSHELRTPLNAMIGYAEILDLDGPLTAGQVEKIDRIKAGGWHLASMIDEILSMARLDDGTEPLEFRRVDAGTIAREAKVLMEPTAKARGLTIALYPPDEAIEVETHALKARQILLNLCGNAVKYTEQGEVGVGVRRVGEEVLFEVSDTGIGIAPNDLPHVFERFWQADGAVTRSYGGMGIGLSAAREFARVLGGDIEAESEMGRGSTFRLRLPLLQPKGPKGGPSISPRREDLD
jgi:two-component system, chemotaxis family, CheB/CheR fusion protein